jgi:hypothetical protein
MNRTLSACIASTAVVVVTGAIAMPGLAGAAADKLQDVFVTNSASSPIPVKPIGTTKVDATGSKVDVTGSSVGITGKVDATGSKVDATGSKVTLDTSGGPVPVQVTNQAPGGASEPEHFQKTFRLDFTNDAFAESDSYTVPDGRGVEIDFASGADTSHKLVDLRVLQVCGGDGGSMYIPLVPLQPGAAQAFTQEMLLHANPGTCIKIAGQRTSAGGDYMYVTLTGHYTAP